jgi:hypothetical protein
MPKKKKVTKTKVTKQDEVSASHNTERDRTPWRTSEFGNLVAKAEAAEIIKNARKKD